MLTGIRADWHADYTGNDHLIDSAVELAINDAVAGQEFRRCSDALHAAERAFRASC